jgi:plasmid stability protein
MHAHYDGILPATVETIMATITIRSLDDDVVERLKARAAANKRSLEAELRDVLSTVAREGQRFDLRAYAERIAAMTPRRRQSDSTALLRKDRRR